MRSGLILLNNMDCKHSSSELNRLKPLPLHSNKIRNLFSIIYDTKVKRYFQTAAGFPNAGPNNECIF